MVSIDGIRSIDELTLENRRVFIRTDFDVATGSDGELVSDVRLVAALPTIRKAIASGARVIVGAHVSAREGAESPSLLAAGARLATLLEKEVFVPDECSGQAARKVVNDLRPGQVCLLENLDAGSEDARADEGLAQRLERLCDVYVNDALSSCLGSRASTTLLARLVKDRGMGYLLQSELAGLGRVANPSKPFVGYIGGKLSDLAPLFDGLLRKCDVICLAGSIAYTLVRARGTDLKASDVEHEQLPLARTLLEQAQRRDVELVLPSDVMIEDSRAPGESRASRIASIPQDFRAIDIGPDTRTVFARRAEAAKTVLWYGSLGASGATSGSRTLCEALGAASAFSVVIGDGTLSSAIEPGSPLPAGIGLFSLGGAASLQVIEGKKLPGVDALRG